MALGTIELVISPIVSPGVDPADPYRYGWRPVRQVGPDGAETWARTAADPDGPAASPGGR